MLRHAWTKCGRVIREAETWIFMFFYGSHDGKQVGSRPLVDTEYSKWKESWVKGLRTKQNFGNSKF